MTQPRSGADERRAAEQRIQTAGGTRQGGQAAFYAAIGAGLSDAVALATKRHNESGLYIAMSNAATAAMDQLLSLYARDPALLSRRELLQVRDHFLTQDNRAAKVTEIGERGQ